MGVWDALIIGIAQGIAIIPGISRSGSTISTGLFCGLNRELAGKFSFLLSIPAILGATFLEFREIDAASGIGVTFDRSGCLLFRRSSCPESVMNIVKKGKLSYFFLLLLGRRDPDDPSFNIEEGRAMRFGCPDEESLDRETEAYLNRSIG